MTNVNRPIREGEKILIENIIDACGMPGVLQAIFEICVAKAEHIETNWQDAKLAQVWDYRAAAVEKLVSAPSMQGA